MNRNLSLITLIATISMLAGAMLMVAIFGFDLPSPSDPPPVPLYLEPAGYAFIIWAFIYSGFIGLGVFQFRRQNRDDPRFLKARPAIIINVLANLCWFGGVILNQLWATVLFMLIMLITLTYLAIVLELGKSGTSRAEFLSVKLPIAFYFGWITAATPVNTTAWLLSEVGWTGEATLGAEGWSVLILLIAAVIYGALFLREIGNSLYLGVGVWALTGIAVANWDVSILVSRVALFLAITLFALLFSKAQFIKRKVALI